MFKVGVGGDAAGAARALASDGGREAEALVGDVELRVVAADEHVAQDPQRPGRRRDVQPHEARQAHRLAHLRHLRVSTARYDTRTCTKLTRTATAVTGIGGWSTLAITFTDSEDPPTAAIRDRQ